LTTPHDVIFSAEFGGRRNCRIRWSDCERAGEGKHPESEHDHSSSNPGQENRGLLALNPNSNTPPPTDHGDLVPLWYSFDLVKKRVEEGGWTHQITQRELPSSHDIAGVNLRLIAGGYREMHWHTADEWAYVLYGNARVTVMNPDGTMFIGDVSEGDLWIFPAGFPHSIQGLGPDGTEFLLVFNQGNFSEDGTMLLSEWIAHTPPEVLAKNTGLEVSVFEHTPGAPLYIFPARCLLLWNRINLRSAANMSHPNTSTPST
jgi:oxalate decarboxylase